MNKKKIIKNIVFAIFIIAIFGGVFWLVINPPSYKTKNSYRIPDTELTVAEVTQTISGSEGISRITEYYLLNKNGDTLSKQLSPYQTEAGLVYIIDKGIYDCREEDPFLILDRSKINENYLYFYKEKGSITIIDGHEPMIKLPSKHKIFKYK